MAAHLASAATIANKKTNGRNKNTNRNDDKLPEQTAEVTVMDSYLANHLDNRLDDALLFSTTITRLSDTVNPTDETDDDEHLEQIRNRTSMVDNKRKTITAPIAPNHMTAASGLINLALLNHNIYGSGLNTPVTPHANATPNTNATPKTRFTFTLSNASQSNAPKTKLTEDTDTCTESRTDTICQCIEYKESQRHELELKCTKLSSMNNKLIFVIIVNLQIILVHDFENIGVDKFWDKFWSNDAIFSPIDWIKHSPLTSNIESTQWVLESNHNKSGNKNLADQYQWYTRYLTCIQKSDGDMDHILCYADDNMDNSDNDDDEKMGLQSSTVSKFDTVECKYKFKYSKIKPRFYVATKTISFVDFATIHQKFELRQNTQIVKNRSDEYKIAISTNMKIYFGVEWLKPMDYTSDIESKELVRIRHDCLKYCQFIDKKILTLNSKNKNKDKTFKMKSDDVTIEMEDDTLSLNEPSIVYAVSTML